MAYQSYEQALLMALGEAVRQARVHAGLSQDALADASGLHRTYVSSLERGERNIGILNVCSLATAPELPVSQLLEALPHAKLGRHTEMNAGHRDLDARQPPLGQRPVTKW
jgi:transcriptional regulator with XRE-family HTH domain